MEKEQFSKRLVELRMNKGVSARDMSLLNGKRCFNNKSLNFFEDFII